MNKKTINKNGIFIRTLSKMRAYCNMFHNFSIFSTLGEGLFLYLVCQMCQIFWHLAHLRELMRMLLSNFVN